MSKRSVREYMVVVAVLSVALVATMGCSHSAGTDADKQRIDGSATDPDKQRASDAYLDSVVAEERRSGYLDSVPAGEGSEHASHWVYTQSVDQMRGRTTRLASLTSDNELEFDFPYNGGSRGYLTLRRGRDGLSVILQVGKGQFTNTSEGGEVAVKFDNGPIVSFHCDEASSGKTDIVFLEPAERFLRSLRRSSRVIIEAEFYQEGHRQLTFDTVGLDPKW